MSEPFIAEIRIFAGNFAPRSWAFCNGQLLPIAQNTALFSLIGTTYGGDGRTTTALPNLQGRAPMHPGRGPGLTSRRLGQFAGAETTALSETQLPKHLHSAMSTPDLADSAEPSNKVVAITPGEFRFSSKLTSEDLSSEALQTAGGSQSHNNMQPFIAINYIIALQGLYPSRS
ncbi:Phage Tail Collar Domain protein [Pseudovibrio axinellae]|uniref:Phage Tail Collar Domain protein n=1 Tax=Pseudovibrio axinellae TaxID=989403 RepID=A0A165UPP0_9HYPH|nr:tail fiber protein [Pseudovibrio axinellae]KZL12669.1 Phage Tail Collar Domain protein [Pseudovibrio axinellae]SEP62214.1 Microcystin-dependent protein [Pseudovibrio axinellae]